MVFPFSISFLFSCQLQTFGFILIPIVSSVRQNRIQGTKKEPEMQGEKIMKSKETRQVYRVIREYKHLVMVKPADRKWALPFSLPKEWLEEVPAKA